jgi:hypothetical protein
MVPIYEKIGMFEEIESSYSFRQQEVILIFKSNWDLDTGFEILSDLDKKRYKYSIEDNKVRVKEQKKFEYSETRKTFLVGKLEENDCGTIIKFKVYIKPFEFLFSVISSFIMLLIISLGIFLTEGNTKLLLIGLLVISPVAFGRLIYEWSSALKKMKYEFERELRFILDSNSLDIQSKSTHIATNSPD